MLTTVITQIKAKIVLQRQKRKCVVARVTTRDEKCIWLSDQQIKLNCIPVIATQTFSPAGKWAFLP